MTVWVVMVDDGNVCCLAQEFDSVWSDAEMAESRAIKLEEDGRSCTVMGHEVDKVPE